MSGNFNYTYIGGWQYSQLAFRREADTVHYWANNCCPSNSVWIVPGTQLED